MPARAEPLPLERVLGHLKTLGIRELDEASLAAHLRWVEDNNGSSLDLLEHIFAEAAGRRLERRIERRIARSGLKVRKTLEAFDWDFQPGLDRAVIEQLATLRFVERHEDVLFTGKAGTGKSHILQAVALRACKTDLSVRYARGVDLIDDLYAGLADDTYPRRLKRWVRPDLLVIDDVGLGQLRKRDDEPTAAHMLFNLLDQRHLARSTAITSNIKLKGWGRYLGDATLVGAILDRLAMSAIRIDVDGPSYRQHLAKQRARKGG